MTIAECLRSVVNRLPPPEQPALVIAADRLLSTRDVRQQIANPPDNDGRDDKTTQQHVGERVVDQQQQKNDYEGHQDVVQNMQLSDGVDGAAAIRFPSTVPGIISLPTDYTSRQPRPCNDLHTKVSKFPF